ncbi:probable E3 ubiquitin-protein ligase DTX3 [Ruditapes philippinarum]|uniref:probable E3 ubiquitin-protein ligase DTX3 n=1 Tax=Ruditapes philippinarum TaxID=129788 RepID=UPI00295A6B04|nr:probable E3 ubiquitin-protein ligase DTX3 [Ruditapes philippinarum]
MTLKGHPILEQQRRLFDELTKFKEPPTKSYVEAKFLQARSGWETFSEKRRIDSSTEADVLLQKDQHQSLPVDLNSDYNLDILQLPKGHPLLEEQRIILEELSQSRENPKKSDWQTLHEIGTDNLGERENCPICLGSISDQKQLRCGHSFCQTCIKEHHKYKYSCPVCNEPLDILIGDQPPGTMTTTVLSSDCAGYKNCGTIEIKYRFPDGHQGGEHPCPGRKYEGTLRTAYLPNNAEGRKIAKLLRVAFERRLVFTIGTSLTTGRDGVIIWNGIAHKTVLTPNSEFGYPDPEYIDVVKTQLAAKGVTEKDIDNNHF